MREALRIFGGSVLVYAIVAACSAGGRSGSAGTSSSGGNGAGGMTEVGGATAGALGTAGQLEDGGIVDAMVDAMGDALDAMTDPVDDAMAWESGTRLKVRRYVSPDGASQPIGWFDSERNESCSFAVASDGQSRCLPIPGAHYDVGLYYTDAGCSMPAVVQSTAACTAAPAYAYTLSADCSTRYRIFEVGSKVTSGDYYTKSGETCPKATCTSGCAVYHRGAEVAAASFVAAVEQVDE